MPKESILTQDEITGILDAARAGKDAGNQLSPVLLLFTAQGERSVLYLENLPEDSDERPAYFRFIGVLLRTHNMNVAEAVIASEALSATGTDSIKPGQRPQEISAVVVVGRNAENTRMSCVIQPFKYNKQNELVWEKMLFARYNEPVSDQVGVPGVLDDLFDALDQG